MRANPPPQASADSGSGNVDASSSAGQGQLPDQANRRPRRRPTMFPEFSAPAASPGRIISSSNDGVFANLAAKPERGEKNEDLPPVCVLVYIFLVDRLLMVTDL